MAKRRKQRSLKSRTTRNVPEVQHELPGGFWRQVFAVLLLAVAAVLVVSWFNTGGTALTEVHNFINWLIGFAGYLLPFTLAYLAIQIFRSEENWVSVAVWLASALNLVWVAGLATAIAGADAGGLVGAGLSNALVGWVGSGVTIFIYLILIFITIIFILQVNPLTVFQKTEELIKPRNREDLVNAEVATLAQEDAAPEGGKKFRFGAGRAKNAKPAKAAATGAPVARPEGALVEISDPDWKTPPMDLLEKRQSQENPGNKTQNAYIIQNTLSEFGINVEMDEPYVGPRVTQYTLRPPAGVNLSKIEARDKELALNLAVDKIRIEAPIPGTRLVGIEIPNVKAADVRLRGILESDAWKNATAPLTFAVGKDISGQPVVADLGKMPHLLIAGTTGSGKSVMTNTLISSLLYRNSPSNMKLIIVDPKQVEMASYEDIPHLLTPVITDVEKTLSAMSWAVNEMERRYTLMAEKRVKKIEAYNQRALEEAEKAQNESATMTIPGEDTHESSEVETAKTSPKTAAQGAGTMPYIVIVIDEMADLMMMAGKDLEKLIVRIAQKGRAAGIHLVLATQRPEVKVITGLIKANIPGRIAFAVGSQVDSRIMLDASGAEKLLGKGDMLMLTTEMMGKPRRIQGAWTSDEDIVKLTDYLRAQRKPDYNKEVISQPVQIGGSAPASAGHAIGGDLGRKFDPDDPIVRKAVEIIIKNKKFSTSSLQTWLGKGHGFVAGLAIWFEEIGVIGPPNGNKPRDVLIQSMDEFDELVSSLE